ncbi:MAG: DHA2 family efflux MFS transporter permease subunit [Alphaproteobacteria bacterium]|nr:DHA2 family efflux MFS transporter permease subunit [Alphaproteobacteria bacterium]
MSDVKTHSIVPNKAMLTVSVMLATIIQVLDTTIANVALPHMQGSLSATQDQITWVLTSYIVATAIMTLPTGWIAGRIGKKQLFMISITGFTLSSVLCGIATSIDEMVLFRVIQGASGAALIPLSQSVLLDINPREKHGSAMAIWGIGVMIGPVIGPTLGGYLTEYYDWRYVFFINLPLGAICLVGISKFMPESEKSDRPFDAFGFIMLALTIASIQLMLDRGQQEDWFNSYEIIAYCGATVGFFWMYIIHSRYARNPFYHVEMFRDRNYVTASCFIFIVGIILLATLALLPPFLQNQMGYSVMSIGVLMAPRGVGTMFGMMIAGRLTQKVDPRKLVLIGMSLMAYSLYEMSEFTTFVPQQFIITTGITQGLGLGMVFVPLSTITFSTLDPKYRTEASSLFNLLRNMGSSIGVSIAVTLLGQSIQTNHSYLAENITDTTTRLPAYLMPQGIESSAVVFRLLDGVINNQAITIGYINDFYLMMWVVICAMPLVVLLSNPLKLNQAK